MLLFHINLVSFLLSSKPRRREDKKSGDFYTALRLPSILCSSFSSRSGGEWRADDTAHQLIALSRRPGVYLFIYFCKRHKSGSCRSLPDALRRSQTDNGSGGIGRHSCTSSLFSRQGLEFRLHLLLSFPSLPPSLPFSCTLSLTRELSLLPSTSNPKNDAPPLSLRATSWGKHFLPAEQSLS